MKITFYAISDSENTLNKTLENGLDVECVLKEYSNVMQLNIVLNYQIDNFNYNYCYIEKLNRYYFISDITIERNNLLSIALKEDVLMTYKEQIKQSHGIIKNTKDNLNGNGYNESNNFETLQYKLDDVFTENSDVLTTVQGI